MRLQKISIFYLVAFFALLPSIGNIWSGENSLDLYDSHARFYDSMIGRTTSQDPLAEKDYHLSPYLWCAANPIKFGDKNGMYLKGIDGNPVFFPYEFYFSDNRARRLTVNFYGKNRLVIENNSYVLGIKIVRDKDRGLFPFRDTIYFHVIDPPQKELSVRHRQIIVDSVTSTRHITASQTVPPYRDIKFEDTNMVFPLLQKSDTIFVSRNNRHLRIRDFEFSVYQYVTLPNGKALKQESVKFPPQERMRPIIYKKFLKWVEEEKSKDDGLVPDETILKIIDKYYDWDAK